MSKSTVFFPETGNRRSLVEILIMDRYPKGEIEFLVFDTLVARETLIALGFCSPFDASCVPRLLSRIEKGTLHQVGYSERNPTI